MISGNACHSYLTGLNKENAYEFKYVRDYEVANTRYLRNEYIFSVDDGNVPDELANAFNDGHSERAHNARPPGAYYVPVNLFQALRKRRPRASLA